MKIFIPSLLLTSVLAQPNPKSKSDWDNLIPNVPALGRDVCINTCKDITAHDDTGAGAYFDHEDCVNRCPRLQGPRGRASKALLNCVSVGDGSSSDEDPQPACTRAHGAGLNPQWAKNCFDMAVWGPDLTEERFWTSIATCVARWGFKPHE